MIGSRRLEGKRQKREGRVSVAHEEPGNGLTANETREDSHNKQQSSQ